MSRIEKLIIKILCQDPPPTDITYEEVCRLLKSAGFVLHRKRGSHRVFKHSGYADLIVLVEGGFAKQYQIEDIRRAFRELELLY